MTKHQSKIEQLIAKLCPEGVEFKELGKLGDFYGGLTGKSKDDFSNGNAKFITYVNIYNNIAVDTSANNFVKISENENQNKIEYGDVIFTGSSETPNDVGMSSVLTEKIDEPLYLNSFCFGFRFQDKDLLLPGFTKYLFRDEQARKQIAGTASGVTRFNISKKRFAKIKIPLPPLEVQREIVDILDKFTQLEAELEAELEARKKQYEHYRNQLLTFDDMGGVRWATLGEVVKMARGVRVVKKELEETGEIPVYQNSMTPLGYYNKSNNKADTTFVITAGAAGEVGYSDVDFWAADDCFALICPQDLQERFLYHFLMTKRNFLLSRVRRASVPRLSRVVVEKLQIPIPPLAEQNRIVAILDKFDALTNSLSEGLPAELKARRQQYEFYRDKLLTFQSLPV